MPTWSGRAGARSAWANEVAGQGPVEFKLRTLVAATETGMAMSDLYPHLKGFCDLPILKPDDPAAQAPADVVFFSTPMASAWSMRGRNWRRARR
jgi:N-acetyl-gamma-glutamyl-phosphate reductase